MSEGQLDPGTVFATDYRIIRTIHAGGLSTLYEAEQISTGIRRALKVIVPALAKDEKLRALFLEEAKRVGRIQSDHICELVACGVDPITDLPYAALELLSGESLDDMVKRRGPLPPSEVLEVLGQVSHALGAAHDAGVVHRDLKPEAIMIAESRSKNASQRCVVLFLGVGKLASEAKHNTTAAMSRPLWMAPEQTETDVTVTPATDVWVQGLLAYYLLTGRHYWKTARDMGSAMMSLMREVLFEDVATASERAREQGVADKLPYGFDPWFARCAAREPAKRFQNAREAMSELSASLGPFAASLAERHGALRGSVPQVTVPGAPILPPPSSPPPRFGGSQPYLASPPPVYGSNPPPAIAAPGYGSRPPPPFAGRHGSQAPYQAQPPRQMGSIPPGGSSPPPYLPPVNPPPRRSEGPPAQPVTLSKPLPVGLIAGAIAALVVLVALGIGVGVLYLRKSANHVADAARDSDDDDSKSEKHKKSEPWSDEGCPVPITSKDPSDGDRVAPVTIVEFSDFQCPFCAKAEATLAALRTQYGPSKVRVVWKNRPASMHPLARPAALAGEAVFELEGSDAFWHFHKDLFAHQSDLSTDSIEKAAVAAGVDRSTFVTRKDDAAVARKVDDDVALGKNLDVAGTPTFFINGRTVSGAQAKEKFVDAIELGLAEAKLESQKGTAPDKIYTTLTQKNFSKRATPAAEPVDHTLYRVPVGGSPMRGSKGALVTIVEFGDFQCPFCQKSEATLATLRDRYGDKLRVVWKDAPLSNHLRAMPAANFAREVRSRKGDEGFWKAHDVLYQNQAHLEDADLSLYSAELGFDGVALVAAVQAEKHKKEIEADQELADELRATGTPVFYINGRKLNGAQAADKFEEIIDEEIPKAQALIAKGTKPEAVYDEITKDGKTGTELETKDPGAIPLGAPIRGAQHPQVVIQEFADLQCAYCKRADATLDQVLKDYGQKVQIVWRHLPIETHAQAQLAAEAAEEVKAQKGNEAFFKFMKACFDAQPNGLDRAGLESMASDLGVDMPTFRRTLDDHTRASRVNADHSVATSIGITATPTFIVGKYVVPGAKSITAFHRAIDQALADQK